jgi:hypothetical protein
MPLIAKPDPTEWDVKALAANGRAYLDDGTSFEEIIEQIFAEASFSCGRADPARACDAPANTWRVHFEIAVSPTAADLFYNAPDGLRGRYWQAAETGDEATRLLLVRLKPKLLGYARDRPNRWNADEFHLPEIEASLDQPSAKVWISEENLELPVPGKQLIVPRWRRNEPEAPPCKVGCWRWWPPVCDHIEVKGGFIRTDGSEFVPKNKRGRAAEIYKFGFT